MSTGLKLWCFCSAECGFESRSRHLDPWARYFTRIALSSKWDIKPKVPCTSIDSAHRRTQHTYTERVGVNPCVASTIIYWPLAQASHAATDATLTMLVGKLSLGVLTPQQLHYLLHSIELYILKRTVKLPTSMTHSRFLWWRQYGPIS